MSPLEVREVGEMTALACSDESGGDEVAFLAADAASCLSPTRSELLRGPQGITRWTDKNAGKQPDGHARTVTVVRRRGRCFELTYPQLTGQAWFGHRHHLSSVPVVESHDEIARILSREETSHSICRDQLRPPSADLRRSHVSPRFRYRCGLSVSAGVRGESPRRRHACSGESATVCVNGNQCQCRLWSKPSSHR